MTTKPRGFGSVKKPAAAGGDAPAATAPAAAGKRFDIADFEKEAVKKAKAEGAIQRVEKSAIRPDPDQPRTTFSPEGLAELKSSIEKHGVLQPIVVRQVDDGYMIIAGESRWRCVMGIDAITHMDVVVRNDVDPLTILLIQIAENNVRNGLTPMDQARAYQRAKDLAGSARAAAEEMKITESAMSITLGLLKAPEAIQKLASDSHIRDITTLNLVRRLHEESPKVAEEVITDILQGKLDGGGVRKEVNTRLQKTKGKTPKAAAIVTRLDAEELSIAMLGERASLKIKTKRGAFEIILPVSLVDLQEMISRAEEEQP